MKRKHNPNLTRFAQKLRKEMTKEERHLWYDFLKELPVTIHRQKVIGNYIVDFYCASTNLVIEIDGSQHYDQEGITEDAVHDKFLNNLELTVKRYTNTEINHSFENVCKDIYYFIFPNQAGINTLSGATQTDEVEKVKWKNNRGPIAHTVPVAKSWERVSMALRMSST